MTNSLSILDSLLKNKKFIHPLSRESSVDLIRAIAINYGLPFHKTQNISNIQNHIKQKNHTLFILVDGMGQNILNTHLKDSVLQENSKLTLNATFPSTTAVSLTSFSTGHWPQDHGIPGWWCYLPEDNIDIMPLPFLERYEQKQLQDYNIETETVFTKKSIYPDFNCQFNCYFPKKINNSVFSRYSTGNLQTTSINSIDHGLDLIFNNIKKSSERTFHYLYLPELDHYCHIYGVNSKQAKTTLEEININIENFYKKIDSNVEIIITADHGLMDIPKSNHHIIYPKDPLLELLITPPTGEPRVPIFHVKDNQHENFIKYFNNNFGDDFILLSKSQAQDLKLFGPSKLAQPFETRIGDFIGISKDDTTLSYIQKTGDTPHFIGFHAGLTAEEMEVPLIVLNKN